ncbi:MAG: hypothetical protein K0Q49_1753 [Haloplasmataceae bacterium]|jgi:hypothetical protein|nr:hypothetical protein [Haloplasmataceae bacterium]
MQDRSMLLEDKRMEKTKNIFDYATKELSQDAFLRWLFENWNCEQSDVRMASQTLLREFLGFEEQQEFNIEELSARGQYKNIDIVVECIINNEKYVIAIEDKTTSNEHNQLLQYSKIIENDFKYYKKFFIYYKTSLIFDDESSRIVNAKWQKYDVNRIYNIFNKMNILLTNCLLIDYIEKIEELNRDFTELYPENIKQWNMNNWYNFSLNHDWQLDDIDINIGNYQNQYLWIHFHLKGYMGLKPFLEIRSRDFKNDLFIIRIEMYGINEELINENKELWKVNINRSEIFKMQNNSKQIGTNIIQSPVSNINDIIKFVKIYIQEFQKIME